MTELFVVEVQRALRRQVVQGLVLVALAGIVFGATIVYFTAELALVSMWRGGEETGALAGLSFLLFMGALVGASSVIGAEWRYGTMATLLAWEPRRVRVVLVKLATLALLAFGFAVALQTLLVAAMAVVAAANGSTAGTDWAWLSGLVGAELRIGVMAAFGAVLAGSLAMIGRSTAAGVAVVGGYLFVVENLLRVWKPGFARWSLADNLTVLVAGGAFRGAVDRSLVGAAAVLLLYVLVTVSVAVALFRQRDVASS